MKKKRLVLCLTILACGYISYGQEQVSVDSLHVEFFFRQGLSNVDPAYCDNETRLKDFADRIRFIQQDSLCQITSIAIRGASSPEGGSLVNERLSKTRAGNIVVWLKKHFSLPDLPISVSYSGIDWQALTASVEASDMPYRDEVLDILHKTPEKVFRNGVLVDSRKRQLQMLHAGKAWFYMEEHFFSSMRNCCVEVTYEIRHRQKAAPEPAPAPVVESEPVPMQTSGIVAQPLVPEETVKPFYMALKTNMLYDLALTPNFEIEFYLGRGWSVGGSWMYAWWKSDKSHYYWRTYGGGLDLRKYFGRRASEKPLTGHHLGIYGQGLTYDFETGRKGYQSKFSYGAGIEYGYSLPIGRRLNLDFGIGIGYLGGEYKVYVPIDSHYVWKETRQRHWFGPTKAEISLVWLIGRGNYNEKGGKR